MLRCAVLCCRYLPSIRAILKLPQCLGMLGGKPGSSTYLLGLQDNVAFLLDPHYVQPVRTAPFVPNVTMSLYCHAYSDSIIPTGIVIPEVAVAHQGSIMFY